MKKQILTLLSVCLIGLAGFSQNNIAINGKVMNEKNEPLANASIIVKNTKAGAVTDEKGNFRLFVASLPVTLQVSYSNLKEQEIIVSNTNELTISMEPSSELLDAVVLQSKGIPTKMLN